MMKKFFISLFLIPAFVLGFPSTIKAGNLLSIGTLTSRGIAMTEADRRPGPRAIFREARGWDPGFGGAVFLVSQKAARDLLGQEIDPAVYFSRLEQMATELRGRIGDGDNPLKVIREMNQYLFRERGFGYAGNVAERLPQNLLLPLVLDQRQGQCLSLSILYLILSERLGIEMQGVLVPNHFFVRYETPLGPIDIETTRGGALRREASDRARFGVSGNPYHYKSLDKKEVFGLYLGNLGRLYERQGKRDGAVLFYEAAIRILPHYWDAKIALANILGRQGRIDRAAALSKAVLAENKDHAGAHHNMALACFFGGKYRLARYHAAQAVRLGLAMNPGLLARLNLKSFSKNV